MLLRDIVVPPGAQVTKKELGETDSVCLSFQLFQLQWLNKRKIFLSKWYMQVKSLAVNLEWSD